MFERYTEPARRALFYARYETSHLGGNAITSEHLLLGILHEPRDVIAGIFARARVDVPALQSEIRRQCAAGAKVPTPIEIPFADDTKRILYGAAAVADSLGFDSIGPEHLVLAILSEPMTGAADILLRNGILLADARREIAGTKHSGDTR